MAICGVMPIIYVCVDINNVFVTNLRVGGLEKPKRKMQTIEFEGLYMCVCISAVWVCVSVLWGEC